MQLNTFTSNLTTTKTLHFIHVETCTI